MKLETKCPSSLNIRHVEAERTSLDVFSCGQLKPVKVNVRACCTQPSLYSLSIFLIPPLIAPEADM